MVHRETLTLTCGAATESALPALSLIEPLVIARIQSVRLDYVGVVNRRRALLLDDPLTREAVLLANPLGAECPIASMTLLLNRRHRHSQCEHRQPERWQP